MALDFYSESARVVRGCCAIYKAKAQHAPILHENVFFMMHDSMTQRCASLIDCLCMHTHTSHIAKVDITNCTLYKVTSQLFLHEIDSSPHLPSPSTGWYRWNLYPSSNRCGSLMHIHTSYSLRLAYCLHVPQRTANWSQYMWNYRRRH